MLGACNYQVVRSSRDPDRAPEGRGFTYNHAAMLAYWQGYFLYEYLAGPKGEHETPSAVYLCKSRDGIHWERPSEIFPPCDISILPYRGPGRELVTGDRIGLVAHHRMGFYTTSQNRLLVSSFYGICPNPHINPNNGYGVGRVVREIYADFTMSEIYFLRYNIPGGYTRENVDLFRPYEECTDRGFVEACEEFLHDRVATQQWWEEERLDEDFFSCAGGAALSYYTLPEGDIMGVFKNSLASISCDGGRSWSKPVKSPTIITSTGKVWGQRMPDGKYALVYNPSPNGAHRWPLAVTAGENGRDFYGLAAIVPEIAPCRYEGGLKNLGAQYMRGITEANRRPDDCAMWIAYSVNKEDMWIARVPSPLRTKWKGPVRDEMDGMEEQELRDTWNLYVPSWGGADLEERRGRRMLHLWEEDLYNRARAERIFEESARVEISLSLTVEHVCRDRIMLGAESGDGRRLLTIVWKADGETAVRTGGRDWRLGSYVPGREMNCMIVIDCRECVYEVVMTQGEEVCRKTGALGAAADSAERVVIATKYNLPFQGLEDNGRDGDIGDLPGADLPMGQNSVYISRLEVRGALHHK